MAVARGILPSLFPVHHPPRCRRRNLSPPLRTHHTIACSTLSQPDESALFQAAAKHVVDTYTKSGMVIGLGSGRASSFAIQYLGRQLQTGSIKDVIGIPTSVSSASEAAKAGIPLEEYNRSSRIDLVFDDADIMEEETLCAVIGRQGLEMIREKTILNAAEKLVFILNGKQYKKSIDGSIPVLINSVNWLETAEEIDDIFLGDAEVWRRTSIGHADPSGGNFPLVTKEGHNVLDVIFTSPIVRLAEVADSLNQIDGVVEHGIIFRTQCTAIIVSDNGLRVVDNMAEIESSKV